MAEPDNGALQGDGSAGWRRRRGRTATTAPPRLTSVEEARRWVRALPDPVEHRRFRSEAYDLSDDSLPVLAEYLAENLANPDPSARDAVRALQALRFNGATVESGADDDHDPPSYRITFADGSSRTVPAG